MKKKSTAANVNTAQMVDLSDKTLQEPSQHATMSMLVTNKEIKSRPRGELPEFDKKCIPKNPPTANSILNDEKLNAFLRKGGEFLGCLLSSFLLIIVLESVARARKRK